MNQILIATDQSSNVLGLSIFEIKSCTLLYSTAIQIKGKSTEARISTVKDTINEYIKDYTGDYILAYCVFEGVQMQRNNVTTLTVLSELLGVIKNNAYEKQIPFITLKPTEWRSHFHIVNKECKKREELKAKAISIVKERFNKDVSDDESEAILIGLCACERLNAEGDSWGIAATKLIKKKKTKKK